MKRSIFYKGDDLRLIIYGCYSLEMALILAKDVSFDNIQDLKLIRVDAGEINITKCYIKKI